MAVSDSARAAIDMAYNASDLQKAVVIGKDSKGNLQLFVTEADTDSIIVLLERAKSRLMSSGSITGTVQVASK